MLQPKLTGPETLVRPDDDANQRLIAAVHPPSWNSPKPPGERYNMVVIGAGTAGLVTAAATAGLGGTVALIEDKLMGGDCLNVGCVPSKGIIRAGRAAAAARGAADYGVTIADLTVDFAGAMRRMREIRADIAHEDGADRFTELGADVYLGRGRFTGRDTVQVGDAELRFARAVIATGTRGFVPPIPGLADAGYLTNETLFELTELPRRLVVIGGGPIGCEMAQTFARLGSDVTLVEVAPTILANDDPDAAAVVARALEADGVTLITGAGVDRVEADGAAVVGDRRLAADAILVAAGRRPNVEDLGLDLAGVDTDRAGVVVDARLRTTNRRVYAAGDIASRYRFTHAADAMARIAVRNALFFGRARLAHQVIPWVTYTDPELAHVGLTPARAAGEGIAIDTYEVPMSAVHRALLDGESDGFIRVHTRKGKGRIVGATLVSSHAGETIGEIALAMQAGIDLGTIGATVHPYPTQALALKRAADAYGRTRLTPFVARLFRWLLRWRRR